MKKKKIILLGIKESKKLLKKLSLALIDIRVKKAINTQNIKDVYFAIYILRDLHAVIGNKKIVEFCKAILKHIDTLCYVKASTTDNLVKSFFIVNDHINLLVDDFFNNKEHQEQTLKESSIIQKIFKTDVKEFLDTLNLKEENLKLKVKKIACPIENEQIDEEDPDSVLSSTADLTDSMVGSTNKYILKPSFNLDIDNVEEEIKKIEYEIGEHSVANIDIDLSNITKFDSAGVQFLGRLNHICTDRKVKLKLVALSDKVKEVLALYDVHTEDIEVV